MSKAGGVLVVCCVLWLDGATCDGEGEVKGREWWVGWSRRF